MRSLMAGRVNSFTSAGRGVVSLSMNTTCQQTRSGEVIFEWRLPIGARLFLGAALSFFAIFFGYPLFSGLRAFADAGRRRARPRERSPPLVRRSFPSAQPVASRGPRVSQIAAWNAARHADTRRPTPRIKVFSDAKHCQWDICKSQ